MAACSVNENFEDDSYFAEICCGSAKLSYCVSLLRKPVLSVDYDRNRHQSWLPVVKLDLSDPKQCHMLLQLSINKKISHAWCALPCGTCSRARDIVLPDGPTPLRSENHIRGLPGLSQADQKRVNAANQIYDNMFVVILSLISVGAKIYIENPSRSWLWSFPEYQLLTRMGFTDVEFQHCKWNGDEPSRNKWTRIRTNDKTLLSLQGPCHSSHQHLAWGKRGSSFVTADEAEYPMPMCEAVVSCIFGPESTSEAPIQESPHKLRRFTASRQPRGRKAHAVIPEFDAVLTLPESAPSDPWHRELRHFYDRGAEGSEDSAAERFRVVGIWRTPEQYLKVAEKAIHPVDCVDSVPEVIREAMKFVFESTPGKVVEHFVSTTKYLTKLVKDLSEEDQKVLNSISGDARKIYAGKKLGTLQYLLDHYTPEWPDRQLVSDIVKGFRLTGYQKFSGVFDRDIPEAPITVEQLRSSSNSNNEALMARTGPSGDDELDLKAWQKTMEELEAGWLRGPFVSVEEVASALNSETPHLSRRFAIIQNQKIRLIDDYLESNINATYSCEDKLTLMDVDSITSVLRVMEGCLAGEESVVSNIGAKPKPVWLHEPWQGTTIDLKAAYKQLCVSSSDLWSSTITVFDPQLRQPALFIQTTLPFGASSSVLNFNRASRYLWYLGTKLFKLIWANFFDDYPIIASKHFSKPCLISAQLFFELLGWTISKGDKQVNFSESFTALGVVFEVGSLSLCSGFVANSAKRTMDMVTLLQSVLSENRLSKKASEVLRGKLQFLESNTFGKVGKAMYTALFRTDRRQSPLDVTDIENINNLILWLQTAKPRKLSPVPHTLPVLIFSDGACEPSDGKFPLTTCGGLLVNNNIPEDFSRRIIYGLKLPNVVLKKWLTEDKSQLVTEAELTAVFIALYNWAPMFPCHRVFVFIDSEPALFSMIRGASQVYTCSEIVKLCHDIIEKYQLFVWFVRIPSKSNPADGPSRLLLKEASLQFDARIQDCVIPEF